MFAFVFVRYQKRIGVRLSKPYHPKNTYQNLDLKKQSEKGQEGSHIMISYNWGSKPIMLQVRDRLKAAGFNVWMDVDNMSKFN